MPAFGAASIGKGQSDIDGDLLRRGLHALNKRSAKRIPRPKTNKLKGFPLD
jgi:hypothetical protein